MITDNRRSVHDGTTPPSPPSPLEVRWEHRHTPHSPHLLVQGPLHRPLPTCWYRAPFTPQPTSVMVGSTGNAGTPLTAPTCWYRPPSSPPPHLLVQCFEGERAMVGLHRALIIVGQGQRVLAGHQVVVVHTLRQGRGGGGAVRWLGGG